MASDRVVVMRDGRIVEEGHPHELITKKGGEFYNTFKDQINEENVRSRRTWSKGSRTGTLRISSPIPLK